MSMFTHLYPGSNLHELNLDWIIETVENLHHDMHNFKAVNKITYNGEWTIVKNYAPWDLVYHGDYVYISKKPVPAGIEITNFEYWQIACPLIVDPVARESIVKILTSLFNSVEFTDTATAAHYTNDYIIVEGVLYKATSNINIGDHYTSGINITSVTVEDIITDITTDISNIKKTINHVTPEMFGAVGDGITDDTDAWQQAVDSGYPVIASSKAIYKCNNIEVTSNTIIDCNDASFICIGNILFDCKGSVIKDYSAPDYSAFENDYMISSDSNYTGMVMLKGTNNVFHARTYYYGGFVGKVVNDRLTGSYPIDVTTVTVEEVDSITVKISNINNVKFNNVELSYIIKCTYNDGSIIHNIKQHDSCFSIVTFNKSMNCYASNIDSICLTYGGTTTYNYPIEIEDSSFCTVENSNMINMFWHCMTTGGNYLCFKNIIKNCTMKTSNGNPAFYDHDNGLGTIIENCILSSVTVGALSIVKNCTIISAHGTYENANIGLQATDNNDIAIYTIKDCDIMGVAGANNIYTGISAYVSPQVVDEYEYHIKEVIIDNVNCKNIAKGRINSRSSAALVIENVNVNNSNMLIMMPCTNLRVSRLGKCGDGSTPAIGLSNVTITNLFITDSIYSGIVGNISKVYITNSFNTNFSISNNVPQYIISNSSIQFVKSVLQEGRVFAKNCIITGSETPYDVIGISGVGYYGRYTSEGYTLSVIN